LLSCTFGLSKSDYMRFAPILIVLFLASCQSSLPDQKLSNPSKLQQPEEIVPVTENAGLRNPTDEFLFPADKEQLLITAKLSRITVPGRSFERMDGSEPSGNVKLVFREFQTAGEIIASGHPMIYVEPSGDTIQFESAGMFEIRAYEGEEELVLKKGNTIRVELTTPTAGKYNFYALNDNTRSWKEKATGLNAVPNRYIQEDVKRLQELELLTVDKPRKPVAYQPSDKVFDIKADPVIYQEFREMGGVLWKYVGTDPELDPAKNLKLFQEKYTFMRLFPKKGDNWIYEVDFCSAKDTVTLDLAPVFPGKLKEKNESRLREKLQKFNEKLREQERLRHQLRNEAKLLREFNVDKLGVYNYDRQFKSGKVIPVMAEFTFEGQPHNDFPLVNVYLIPEGKLAVIKYDVETSQQFAINPYEKNQLIAITEGGLVYALSDKQIRNLNLERSANTSRKIDLKQFHKPAKTGVDLDAILAEL